MTEAKQLSMAIELIADDGITTITAEIVASQTQGALLKTTRTNPQGDVVEIDVAKMSDIEPGDWQRYVGLLIDQYRRRGYMVDRASKGK